MLQRAVGLHQQGDLAAAERLYRSVLRAEPENPDALYLLGTLLYQQGNQGSSALFLHKACALRPDHPESHNNLGLVLQAQGKLVEATAEFSHALRLRTAYSDARFNLANVLREQGQGAAAVDHYRQVLTADPSRAEAHDGLAAALETLGQHSQALAAVDQALALDPTLATAQNNRGAILQSLGRLAEAAAAFQHAVQLAPGFAMAHANLGAVLVQLGDLEAALDHCRQAATLQPNDAVAHNNLGSVYYQIGDEGTAIDHFRTAIRRKPDFAPPHHNLGNCLRRLGNLDEADACYQTALALDPNYVKALGNRGHLLEETDRLDEARKCFQRLSVLQPTNLLWKFRAAGLCPTVFFDNEAIDAYRSSLVAMLADCREAGLRAGFEELLAAGFRPPFNLPFHGRDDRPIKELFAAVFAPSFDPEPAPFGIGTPRVGFVVTDRHERAFAKSIGGFFAHFDARQIEAVVVCSKAGAAKLRTMMPANTAYLALPERPEAIVPALRGSFDLLYYWEVGTDPLNYFLPFCRLAPLQCTSWGIQVTTGIPAMDLYISGRPIEPEDAAAHYSERLVLLETTLSYQHRLPRPAQVRQREHFGLTADDHVYLCPQHLGKFHPDFDPILASILRCDPRGVVVITAGRRAAARRQLEKRFRADMPDVADRIRFLPNQAGDDYASLLLQADVLLDPLPFGGVNTTYDGLSLGKAIVTLPGRFQRGRYTYGCLRTIGVDAGIADSAEDYVRRALRLANEPDYRRDVEARILASSQPLFENPRSAQELQDLLVTLVETARK